MQQMGGAGMGGMGGMGAMGGMGMGGELSCESCDPFLYAVYETVHHNSMYMYMYTVYNLQVTYPSLQLSRWLV